MISLFFPGLSGFELALGAMRCEAGGRDPLGAGTGLVDDPIPIHVHLPETQRFRGFRSLRRRTRASLQCELEQLDFLGLRVGFVSFSLEFGVGLGLKIG